MAKLTAKARGALPSKAFALPGRRFPVQDNEHAEAAIMDSGNLPPEEQAEVKSKARAQLGGTRTVDARAGRFHGPHTKVGR